MDVEPSHKSDHDANASRIFKPRKPKKPKKPKKNNEPKKPNKTLNQSKSMADKESSLENRSYSQSMDVIPAVAGSFHYTRTRRNHTFASSL